jgi:hypothetical protein
MRSGRTWSALAILVGLAGCGPGNGLTLGRVQGKITYKGEPVRWGSVVFVPDASKGTEGPPAMALISREGTYAMATESADDGVIVGFHKVGITGFDPTPIAKPEGEEEPPDEPLEKLAAKAQASKKARMGGRGPSRKKSDVITRTLVDGKTYRVIVPEKVLEPTTSGIQVEVARGSNTMDFDIQEDGTVQIDKN